MAKKVNKKRKIHKLSVVVFDKERCPQDVWENYYKVQFSGKAFVYMGEIPQMPGHCVLINVDTGIAMIHETENFRLATQDEL